MAPALPLFEWQNAFESIAVRQENGDGNGNRIKETIIAVAVSSIVLAILFFVGRGLFLKRQRRSPSVRHSGAGLRGPNDRGIANFPSPAPSLVRLQRMQQQNNGLSMDELDFAAPVKSYVSASDDNNRDKTGDNDDICAVCLEEMEKGTKTRRMPCGHVFDARCIEEWVSKANRCPVCNTSIVEEEELVRIRMAILEGRDPHSNTRQRCRRTRGDNGTFQLRAHLSPEAVEPQELASERAPVPIQVQ